MSDFTCILAILACIILGQLGRAFWRWLWKKNNDYDEEWREK